MELAAHLAIMAMVVVARLELSLEELEEQARLGLKVYAVKVAAAVVDTPLESAESAEQVAHLAAEVVVVQVGQT